MGGEWKSGFCNCCASPKSCMCAYCCPCIPFGVSAGSFYFCFYFFSTISISEKLWTHGKQLLLVWRCLPCSSSWLYPTRHAPWKSSRPKGHWCKKHFFSLFLFDFFKLLLTIRVEYLATAQPLGVAHAALSCKLPRLIILQMLLLWIKKNALVILFLGIGGWHWTQLKGKKQPLKDYWQNIAVNFKIINIR